MPFFAALAVFGFDRLAKIAVLAYLHAGESVRVIPGVLKMTLVLNDGAAFGLFKGASAFFVFISVVVIIAMAIYLIRQKPVDRIVSLGLGLILGGALGNLADRVVIGRVVDFIDFGVWPVFNIADSCITIGTGMVIFSLFVKHNR